MPVSRTVIADISFFIVFFNESIVKKSGANGGNHDERVPLRT